MTQKMVWTGYESDSYDIELHAEWTDVTALYTNTTLSAKTNQVTRWEVTDVPLTLTGIHILLVKDAGTSTVAWTYFVNLTGISGALHHASLVRRDILYTSVNTYYSAQSDIELIFGEENVNRWMDVDNTDNVTKKNNRVNWANQMAQAYIDSRLSSGHYAVPFTSPYPPMITYMAASLAGAYLYDTRRVVDSDTDDRISQQRKNVDLWLKQVNRGQLRILDAQAIPLEMQSKSTPIVHKHSEEVITRDDLSYPFTLVEN